MSTLKSLFGLLFILTIMALFTPFGAKLAWEAGSDLISRPFQQDDLPTAPDPEHIEAEYSDIGERKNRFEDYKKGFITATIRGLESRDERLEWRYEEISPQELLYYATDKNGSRFGSTYEQHIDDEYRGLTTLYKTDGRVVETRYAPFDKSGFNVLETIAVEGLMIESRKKGVAAAIDIIEYAKEHGDLEEVMTLYVKMQKLDEDGDDEAVGILKGLLERYPDVLEKHRAFYEDVKKLISDLNR